MDQFFGDPAPVGALEKALRLVFHTQDLRLKWSHCSDTADFLSQYFAGVLAGAAQVREISHSIAYLANELIENAVKFRAEGDVMVEAGLDGDCFILRITNSISAETSARFQPLLRELTTGEPGDLLIQRIEANADGNGNGSGLGLLTLMSDYGVRLSWRFAKAESDRISLETIARLPLPKSYALTHAPTHHGNQER